jgi:hypothetical protein
MAFLVHILLIFVEKLIFVTFVTLFSLPLYRENIYYIKFLKDSVKT